eukprot:8015688-Pyramimonas_sp.AAC.1
MEVDTDAVDAKQTEPQERDADVSPTKELDSSSEDEAEPAVKAAPPVAAPSGQDVAEPSPATRAPGVPGTPGSLEASPSLADLITFPCQGDPQLVYSDEDDC